jgi:hypothetical protein
MDNTCAEEQQRSGKNEEEPAWACLSVSIPHPQMPEFPRLARKQLGLILT